MGGGEFGGHRQPDAGAVGAGGAAAEEAIEDVAEVFGGDAGAGVGHLQYGPVAVGVEGDGDGPAGGPELDRVGTETFLAVGRLNAGR
jgi:hypothetical protein